MKKIKINIDEYLANDNFISINEETKNIYNNNLLSDIGAITILESNKLSYEKKVSKLQKIIDTQKDSLLTHILEIMLFGIGIKSIHMDNYKEYFLAYNFECQCFYVATYDVACGKIMTYISRDTVTNIITNEILMNK